MSFKESIIVIVGIFLIITIFLQGIRIKKLTSELYEKTLKFKCVESILRSLNKYFCK